MQIQLLDDALPALEAGEPVRKRVLINAEQVLPDSNADLGQLLTVQSTLLLKGKEIGVDTVTISGEILSCVQYLSEGEGALSSLTVRRSFRFDAGLEGTDPSALPQLDWTIARTEARPLNSRKLAVNYEIEAEIRPFRSVSFVSESRPPEIAPDGIRTLDAGKAAYRCLSVTEKAFVIREQVPLPSSLREKEQLLSKCIGFNCQGFEQIGSRAIVKGALSIVLWYKGENGLPRDLALSVPFSQLLDIGETAVCAQQMFVCPSSLELELVQTIEGDLALDAEVHAILQLAVWTQEDLRYIQDAYSLRADCVCHTEERDYVTRVEHEERHLDLDTRLAGLGDGEELLASWIELGVVEPDEKVLRLPVTLDLLTRMSSGELSSARRSCTLEAPAVPGTPGLDAKILQHALRATGEGLELHLEALVSWERRSAESIRCVRSLDLDEDGTDSSSNWSVALVRPAGESLWELAKAYRADLAEIRAWNDEDAEVLLIPRA
ncbi:MAG: LysM peptidoglycan-binding domain-containing protein [Oscillospiraceae bacterium]|nr:LysM peptidoglycan-binding domain-containing protein [Oscillospiraceae bacterium]